ncbi:two-component system, OmpR family, KDP operon response regulator KdpE [Devosia enhydra]|uniref:Two-component system, OmpR family, KDP operon response regulator KdpE n=1 Tax=Devosia enhydra TaxID=665118 RepID=A0A1K2HZS4_9HYPH|nr:response regulator [Devosia enhydra]SFZ85435.1 two-component system, OmpR family, KDP operon response regulator KdpE [Devosia enhydra]
MKPRILVVDDEPQIQRFLKPALQASDFEVETADTAAMAMRLAATRAPALIVLDLGLPDGDGKAVIARLRSFSQVPIIVLSARDQETEKIAALDAGADDYIEKPFGIGELLARIRVALRRAEIAPSPPVGPQALGPVVLDRAMRRVTQQGAPVHLTPKEYDLLVLLADNAGKVVTHAMALERLWGPAHRDDVHYLRVLVGQLRAKIDGAGTSLITNEAGVGYRLEVG